MSEVEARPSLVLLASSLRTAKSIAKLLGHDFEVHLADEAEVAWCILLEQEGVVLCLGEKSLAMDQFGLLERIREASDTRLAATPVLLLMNEQDDEAARETAIASGATDFVDLPFSSIELTARVRLHADMYLQQGGSGTLEVPKTSAANVLHQLSQESSFNSRLQQEYSFSLRHKNHLSLCKLGLNDIKAIVAAQDKSAALAVIQQLAGIIQQTLRREDSLCYLGNGEFYILFSATNGIGAAAGVKRILKKVALANISIADKSWSLTLSAAIYSCLVVRDVSLEKVYAQLARGLKHAVSLGGNQIVNSAPVQDEPEFSIDSMLLQLENGDSDGLDKKLLQGMRQRLE